MRVRELMAPVTASVSSEASLEEVARVMSDSACVFLPVIDSGHPVGVVTDIDIDQGRQAGCPCVRDVMSSPAIAVTTADDGEEAVRRMLAHHVRHLIVLEGVRVAGMVSLSDLSTRLPSREVEAATKHLAEHNRRSDNTLGKPNSTKPYFG